MVIFIWGTITLERALHNNPNIQFPGLPENEGTLTINELTAPKFLGVTIKQKVK